MADVKQESPVNDLLQKIEYLEIALKASSDAYQSAREQAKKDRKKYQDEVDRICEAVNIKELQWQQKAKHFTIQPFPSKPQFTHQAQQTLHEDLHVDEEQQTLPTDLLATPQPVKDIDTVSTQTDQDHAVLASLDKISMLEKELSQMDHNQDLLLSELNLQKKDNLALQLEINMMTKKMAEVIYANNLYHVSHLEQNCTLPHQLSSHQISPPTTPTLSTARNTRSPTSSPRTNTSPPCSL